MSIFTTIRAIQDVNVKKSLYVEGDNAQLNNLKVTLGPTFISAGTKDPLPTFTPGGLLINTNVLGLSDTIVQFTSATTAVTLASSVFSPGQFILIKEGTSVGSYQVLSHIGTTLTIEVASAEAGINKAFTPKSNVFVAVQQVNVSILKVTAPGIWQIGSGSTSPVTFAPINTSTPGNFFVLDGDAGGQVANGGTAASENLTLRSNATATQGDIIVDGKSLQPLTTASMDIGSPTHVFQDVYVSGNIERTAGGFTAQLQLPSTFNTTVTFPNNGELNNEIIVSEGTQNVAGSKVFDSQIEVSNVKKKRAHFTGAGPHTSGFLRLNTVQHSAPAAVTLPASSAALDGETLSFFNLGSATLVISAAGADVGYIEVAPDTGTSITLIDTIWRVGIL